MFATTNSGKVVFTLICIVFSCFLFFLMSCDTNSDIQAEKPENTKPELEPIADELWQQTPESVREYIINLEKLVEKLPQATIENVEIKPKKSNMDIDVTFNIKNRKDIECSVTGYLYQRRKEGKKFEKLEDKKGKHISISKKFTPKLVTERRTVTLSISYAELNVTQQRELKFDFYIYDKPTDEVLNKLYSQSFPFDP